MSDPCQQTVLLICALDEGHPGGHKPYNISPLLKEAYAEIARLKAVIEAGALDAELKEEIARVRKENDEFLRTVGKMMMAGKKP